jgi:hypothetical protein
VREAHSTAAAAALGKLHARAFGQIGEALDGKLEALTERELRDVLNRNEVLSGRVCEELESSVRACHSFLPLLRFLLLLPAAPSTPAASPARVPAATAMGPTPPSPACATRACWACSVLLCARAEACRRGWPSAPCVWQHRCQGVFSLRGRDVCARACVEWEGSCADARMCVQCEGVLERLERMALPSLGRFDAKATECAATFDARCVGPARARAAERLHHARARERARFQQDYNTRLYNGLTLLALALALVCRFAIKQVVLEMLGWAAFVFLEARPCYAAPLLCYTSAALHARLCAHQRMPCHMRMPVLAAPACAEHASDASARGTAAALPLAHTRQGPSSYVLPAGSEAACLSASARFTANCAWFRSTPRSRWA